MLYEVITLLAYTGAALFVGLMILPQVIGPTHDEMRNNFV